MAKTLLINGTVGVGKTSVGAAVSAALEGRIAHAVIDTDAIRQRSPAPANDPFDLELELANLTALSRNYTQAGCKLLIVSGVIESQTVVERYVQATGCLPRDFHLVRLVAPLGVIAKRIEKRSESEQEKEWHLRRAPQLAGIQEDAGMDEVLVTADQPLTVVVEAVLALLDLEDN